MTQMSLSYSLNSSLNGHFIQWGDYKSMRSTVSDSWINSSIDIDIRLGKTETMHQKHNLISLLHKSTHIYSKSLL